MQERYVGDVGDFGKYYLLNSLCQGIPGGKKLPLGVQWYLVPDESHNADGKHIKYLESNLRNFRRFRAGNPDLYDSLQRIIVDNNRCISAIRERNILPVSTTFYEELITYEGMIGTERRNTTSRFSYRSNWVHNAVNLLKSCDLVFFDPDNGLEVESIKRYQDKGPKYVYYDELTPYVERGQSIVVYHHACRDGTVNEQVSSRRNQIKVKLGVDEVYSIVYRRGTVRVYFIIPAIEHQNLLRDRLVRAIDVLPWSEHFNSLVMS